MRASNHLGWAVSKIQTQGKIGSSLLEIGRLQHDGTWGGERDCEFDPRMDELWGSRCVARRTRQDVGWQLAPFGHRMAGTLPSPGFHTGHQASLKK